MERSVAELIEKDIDREHMTEDEHKAFVDYWFAEYERTGFASAFKTPYTDEKKYEGQTFDVLGRCGEDAYDLEVLPVWKIRLACGVEIDAYPEEICVLERLAQLGFANKEVTQLFSHDASTPTKPVMKAIDIDWDVDEEEDRNYLPNEIEIPVGMVDEDEISDYVSDVTGFCHKGFRLTISVPGPTCCMLTDDGSPVCGVDGSEVSVSDLHYDESSSGNSVKEKNVLLSNEAKKLYEIFKKRYIDKGYMYSGMIPLNVPSILKFPMSTIHELVDAGILQKRNCEGDAYEFTVSERKNLIDQFNLSVVWEKGAGSAFYPNRHDGEVTLVNKALENLPAQANKFSLDQQIHSASIRSCESQFVSDANAKEPDREI